MNSSDLAKWVAAAIGAMLVLVGVIGFVQNPIVGEPDWGPIFVAGTVHNIVHIATGAVGLFIAFGLSGAQRAYGLIGYGALYAAVLVVTLLSPELFGLFQYPVNMADHILHLALAVVPIAVGWYVLQSRELRTAR